MSGLSTFPLILFLLHLRYFMWRLFWDLFFESLPVPARCPGYALLSFRWQHWQIWAAGFPVSGRNIKGAHSHLNEVLWPLNWRKKYNTSICVLRFSSLTCSGTAVSTTSDLSLTPTSKTTSLALWHTSITTSTHSYKQHITVWGACKLS